MAAPDFPYIASMQDQLREYYSRKILAVYPEMVTREELQFGNVQELYIRMVNAGLLDDDTPGLSSRVSILETAIATKAQPNGLASLDSGGILSASQVPAHLAPLALDHRYLKTNTAFDTPAPTAWTTSQVVMPKADMLAVMASASKTSIYLPCIIAIPDDVPGKLADYYIYWSTDHDNNTGGIFMAYADHPMGPYTGKTFPVSTQHKFGTAYCDNGYVGGGGDQTEGPWVIDTFVNGPNRFLLYYQNRGTGTGSQSTCVAGSPNALDWTRIGIAVNFPSTSLFGDGHMGYFTGYRFGDRFFGYSLMGGGDFSRQVISYSQSGLRYTVDRRILGYQTNITGTSLLRTSMAMRLFEWRGEIWGNFALKTPSAGAGGGGIPDQYQTVVSRMSDDFRHFKGGKYQQPFGANSFVQHEGRLYGLSLNTSTGIVAASLGA